MMHIRITLYSNEYPLINYLVQDVQVSLFWLDIQYHRVNKYVVFLFRISFPELDVQNSYIVLDQPSQFRYLHYREFLALYHTHNLVHLCQMQFPVKYIHNYFFYNLQLKDN